MGLKDRFSASREHLAHAWNAFKNPEDAQTQWSSRYGYGLPNRPDRVVLHGGNAKTIISSIYTQIAMDVSAIDIRHVRLDENGHWVDTIDSNLNRCLTMSPNIDQTPSNFKQDMVMSMFDEGHIAVVPVDTSVSIRDSSSFDINSLRVGKVVEWFPKYVRILLYNDRKGEKEEILLPKGSVALIENPFYSVMNEQNSIGQRLIRKLNQLDAIDGKASSGKLDLIIQLPYQARTEIRKNQAEERLKSLENQLANSPHGIGYIDSTEKVVQLNRAVENKLLEEIDYETSMLFSQLGLSKAIFDGTADEATMLNYYNRTVERILSVIVEEFRRKFLTQTARTQGQSIVYFRDPFKLTPTNNLADIADRFTRNEILSSNEFRSIIGYKPVDDPRADELRNKNLRAASDQLNENDAVTTAAKDTRAKRERR